MKVTIEIAEADARRLEDLASWGKSYQYQNIVPSRDPDTAYELYQAVLRISSAIQNAESED